MFQPILDALGWKAFDLDPCSHPRSIVPATDRILLPQYEGQYDGRAAYGDGLKITWRKQNVWLNTPYSHLQYPKRYPWLVKAKDEARRCVGFLPSRTSSGWWHESVLPAPARCYLRGRVQHVGEKWGSPFHQTLAFWGFTKKELDALERALDVRRQGKHWFERTA